MLIGWFRMLKTLFCVSSGFCLVFLPFSVSSYLTGSLEVLTRASGSMKEGTGVHAKQTQNWAF